MYGRSGTSNRVSLPRVLVHNSYWLWGVGLVVVKNMFQHDVELKLRLENLACETSISPLEKPCRALGTTTALNASFETIIRSTPRLTTLC